MAWCAAVGCNNRYSSNKDVSYFGLPKRDDKLRKAWLENLNRKENNLPENIFICSNHFTDECFDKSWELQNRLSYSNRPKKKKLVPNAVPTVFPHKTSKQPSRSSSVARARKKERAEVVENAIEQSENVNLLTNNFADITINPSVEVQTFPVIVREMTKFKDRGTQYKTNTFRNSSTEVAYFDVAQYFNCKTTQTERFKSDTSCNRCKADFERFKALEDYEESSSSSEEDERSTMFSSSEEDSDNESTESPIHFSMVPLGTHFEFNNIEDIQRVIEMLGYTCSFPNFLAGKTDSSLRNTAEKYSEDGETSSECSEENHDLSFVEHIADNSFVDPEYQPDTSINYSDDEEFQDTGELDNPFFSIQESPMDICDQNVLLVYEANLLELMKFCAKCGAAIVFKKEFQNTGSQLTVQFDCQNGCNYRWSSQPPLKNTKGCGNILIPAAAEFSGIPFNKLEKFGKFLRLRLIKRTSYYTNRANYVFPEIKTAWKTYQYEMVEEIRNSNTALKLCSDGQCDSPGHNATYNTVSMMDVSSNRILDFEIVHVAEVSSSNAMEKEAFIRSLSKIIGEFDLNVSVVSTDRHPAIKKLMKTDKRFSHIKHQFDAWHVAKSILKKLMKSANKKDTRILSRWAPSVINHLYWSINTCNGDGKALVERFTSVIHHIVNRHTFPQNNLYKKCDHDELTDDYIESKEWLVPGSPAHELLIGIVTQPLLKADMENMAEQVNTTLLEVFHGKKIRYLPKSTFYRLEKMEAGTMIAALEHNYNVNRPQKFTDDIEGNSKPQFTIAYSKPNKRFVAKIVKEDLDHSYVYEIFRKITERVARGEKLPDEDCRKHHSASIIAPTERPDRETIIRDSAMYKRLRFENKESWNEINEVFENSSEEEFSGFESDDEWD